MYKLVRGFVLLAIGLVMVGFCGAQDNDQLSSFPNFKIGSQVFIDGSREAVCTNETFFHAGLVIDYQYTGRRNGNSSDSQPAEICIYDARNKKFILLDTNRRLRLDLDLLQLMRISAAMKMELADSEVTVPLVFNDFKESFDTEENMVSVTNETLTYTSKGIRPADEKVLQPYYDFLDKYALIAVTDPARMPPYARLVLNQTVKKYGLVPRSIELEFHPKRTGRAGFKASSKHDLILQLNDEDYSKIKMAKLKWTQFRKVELPEYRQINVADASEPVLDR